MCGLKPYVTTYWGVTDYLCTKKRDLNTQAKRKPSGGKKHLGERGGKKRGLGPNNDALTTCKAIDFASQPEVIRLFDSRSTFPAKFDSEL